MPGPLDRLRTADYPLPQAIVDDTLSPALLIYLRHVRDNLRRVLHAAGNRPERWRPHVKTAKVPEILDELIDAGIRQFKCATIREARHLLEALARHGIGDSDVLVAYPLVGPGLVRLGELALRHPQVALSVLCEDPAAVEALPERLGTFVDVNPGMHRTGVPLDDRGTILDVARRAGSFRGVHFYDGHLAGLPAGETRRRAHAGYDELGELVVGLERAGVAVEEIVTSGTTTFLHALDHPELSADERHRVSPGTVIYHDGRSENDVAALGLIPAAIVFSRVVSHPAPDVMTCDAGSKSMAAEAGDPCAYAVGQPDVEALTPSEEHLPLQVRRGRRLDRGEPLRLVPRHVCPTVNLAETAILIDGERIRDVVAVACRAHDL